MKIRVLGSGTSSGVPLINCDCRVCCSLDEKNKRLRSSIFINIEDSALKTSNILIDCGPDFRSQVLQNKIKKIDAVLFTHGHADHILGIDELRYFNFSQKNSIPTYAESKTAQELRSTFSYCFATNETYEGWGVPQIDLRTIKAYQSFSINDEVKVMPLRIFHGSMEILGFRINNFAYLTDCNFVPEKSLELLKGIDVLIVDGLRMRPHKTHFSITEAYEFSLKTTAKRIFLTHLNHEVEHTETNKFLSNLAKDTDKTIELAYDGLEITV